MMVVGEYWRGQQVGQIHPEGRMNVRIKFHGNPSSSC